MNMFTFFGFLEDLGFEITEIDTTNYEGEAKLLGNRINEGYEGDNFSSLKVDYYTRRNNQLICIVTEKEEMSPYFLPTEKDIKEEYSSTTQSLKRIKELIQQHSNYMHEKFTPLKDDEEKKEIWSDSEN